MARRVKFEPNFKSKAYGEEIGGMKDLFLEVIDMYQDLEGSLDCHW